MRSFFSKPIPSSTYWEGLYLLFAVYLLIHPPLAFPQAGAVVLGGGLALLLFRGVPQDALDRLGLGGILFLLYAMVSAFWSLSPGFTLRSSGLLFLAVLLYFMNRQSSFKSQDRVETLLLLFAFLAAGMGLYQWLFGFQDLARVIPQLSGVEADQVTAVVHNRRAFGPLVTPGALAALLIFFLPQVLARCWTASGISRALWGLGALWLLAGLAATGGVGAWVCLALALAFLLYRQGARMALGVIALALMAVLLALIAHRGIHSWTLAAFSMRLQLWQAAWGLFLQRPWFGWGLGTFGDVYQQAGLSLDKGALYPHNLLLQLLVETGIAGTGLFLLALVGLIRRFQWPARWAGWGVMGGLIAVSLFSLIDLPFQMEELVWVFAGVAGRLEFRSGRSWNWPVFSTHCLSWVLLGVLLITGFWPPYRPWNFALLATVLWVAFALVEGQIGSVKPWVFLGAFYLALRAFNSPSASGAVWFLALSGLALVFYQLVPRLSNPRRFLLWFSGLGLIWALNLVWYCWKEAPTGWNDWIHFQLMDVEPWIFHPNPKHLGIFLIPFFFLLPAVLTWPKGLRIALGAVASLIVLRLKALSALVGLALAWLWEQRRNPIRFFGSFLVLGAALAVLRGVNSSATKWGRLDIWVSALKVWSRDIWLGVGPGVFDGAFHQVQSPRLDGVGHYLMDARYAHNEFLDLLTAFGLLGFLFVGVAAWKTWKKITEIDRQQSLIGLGTASFFDFCLHTPLIALLAMGLVASEKMAERRVVIGGAFLVLGLCLGLFASPVFEAALQTRAVEAVAGRDYPSAARFQREASQINSWDFAAAQKESELDESFYFATGDDAWRKKADEALDRAIDLEQADGDLVFEKAKVWSRRAEARPTPESIDIAGQSWFAAEQALSLNAYVFFEEGFFWVALAQQTHQPLAGPDHYGAKALENYEKATVLEPFFAEAWFNRGLCERALPASQGGGRSPSDSDLRQALLVYDHWNGKPGLSPEERQLVGLLPDQEKWLRHEVRP